MKSTILAIVGIVGCAASTASAAPILSFGYTDVSGSFDTGTSVFEAVAVDDGALATAGDVTRLAAPGGTANFDAGFVSASAFADVSLSMDITAITATDAAATGHMMVTDNDGDAIHMDVSGSFTNGGSGFYFFTGLLSNVNLVGAEFNGTDGGAFDMDLPGDAPYNGALVQLFLDTNGGFFTQDFDGISVQLDGEILPTPGSVALLGLAGLVTTRRRRA
jgi:hypothetical protein